MNRNCERRFRISSLLFRYLLSDFLCIDFESSERILFWSEKGFGIIHFGVAAFCREHLILMPQKSMKASVVRSRFMSVDSFYSYFFIDMNALIMNMINSFMVIENSVKAAAGYL